MKRLVYLAVVVVAVVFVQRHSREPLKPNQVKLPPTILQGDSSMVVESRAIHIPGLPFIYNGSIMEKGDGSYCMAFRADDFVYFRSAEIKKNRFTNYFKPKKWFSFLKNSNHQANLYKRAEAHIFLVDLDENFQFVEGSLRKLDTGSRFSEDPRLVKLGGQGYVVYNDLLDLPKEARAIHLAKLDPKMEMIVEKQVFDPGLRVMEKNWVPFEVEGEKGETKIAFSYQASPHKVLYVNLATPGAITLPVTSNLSTVLPWKASSLGAACGGTPALKIGEDYLTFFHSHFLCKKKQIWYVMGAMLFEGKDPYKIKAMSNAPIVFKGMYDSPIHSHLDPKKHVIYPAGFVPGLKNGKEVFYVSCGENDAAIKLLTIDKEALFKSMVPCHSESGKGNVFDVSAQDVVRISYDEIE